MIYPPSIVLDIPSGMLGIVLKTVKSKKDHFLNKEYCQVLWSGGAIDFVPSNELAVIGDNNEARVTKYLLEYNKTPNKE